MSKKPTTASANAASDPELAELLSWVATGERLQTGWGAKSGKPASKFAASLDKHLKKLRKQITKLEERRNEPPRILRRLFGLSYAAIAGVSSMA